MASRAPAPLLRWIVAWGATSLVGLTACGTAVESFTTRRVVPRAAAVADVDQVCTLGTALRHALAAPTDVDSPPHIALIIAETTAAICAEREAWEAELAALRARRHLTDDVAREAFHDARLVEQRFRKSAAERFLRAFHHLDEEWGPIGEAACPSLADDEQFAFLLGLFSGTAGVLHGKASRGEAVVPLDVVARVGRAATCLDDETWWHFPSALQAASWAMVPGSGPAGKDPWALLEEHAARSDATGVRLARALAVLLAANAGRDLPLRAAIHRHADALERKPGDPAWILLDEYARTVSLHQSDILWTEARGHRTERLGILPGDEAAPLPAPTPSGPDDGEADPFAPAESLLLRVRGRAVATQGAVRDDGAGMRPGGMP